MKTWQVILGATALSTLAALAIVRGPQWFGPATGTGQGQADKPSGTPLPWQVTVQPDGSSEALGLKLGTGTLADVRQRFGPDTQIAIIAAPGEDGALEAFVDPAQAGFIAGKLVVTAELPASASATLRSLRERALKSEFMESTTRKYTLTPADQHAASAFAVSAIAFIPQAKLDAQMVIDRFGPPQERRKVGEMSEHFLYPAKGLDLTLNTKGKDVLQYVAPADFHKLTAPLK